MSEGPIKREREARTSPTTTNTGADAVHGAGAKGRGYCGRRATTPALNWAEVTCSDCHAARRADLEAPNLRKDGQ